MKKPKKTYSTRITNETCIETRLSLLLFFSFRSSRRNKWRRKKYIYLNLCDRPCAHACIGMLLPPMRPDHVTVWPWRCYLPHQKLDSCAHAHPRMYTFVSRCEPDHDTKLAFEVNETQSNTTWSFAAVHTCAHGSTVVWVSLVCT